MASVILRGIATAVVADETSAAAAAAAAATAAALPGAIAARAAALQTAYDNAAILLADILDALNNAVTGGLTGTVVPGVVASSTKPVLNLGASSTVQVGFYGKDTDGTVLLYAQGAYTISAAPAPGIVGQLARFYTRTPSAKL